MGSAASTLNVPEILKEIWHEEIEDYKIEGMAAWGLVPKSTDWDGEILNVTVMIGGMAGRSNTFENSLENKSPSRYKRMQVETSDNFATWAIEHKLITLSRNNRGALVRALDAQTRHAFDKFKRSVGWQLWGNGGGAWGEIASIAGDTITLVDIEDATRVDIDDVVLLSDDDGVAGGGLRPYNAKLTVTGVNEKTGEISFDDDVTTAIPGATTGDFLFFDGDYGAALYGFPAYIPFDDPGTGSVPASIWGMDRTSHRTKLAGVPIGGAGLYAHEGISKALSTAKRLRVNPTHLFMSPALFNELDRTLGSARRYADEKVGRVGFTGIEFANGDSSPVRCYPDIDIKGRKVYGLDLPAFDFKSADDFPMWMTIDGKKEFFTESNANAFQGRIGGYGQLYPEHMKHLILDFDQVDP